ncbi:MAG: RDD family protein [Casimicrobiaceae bacterium]
MAQASASPRLASLARRLGALLYEALLLTALVFVASFALLPLVSVSPGRAGQTALTLPDLPSRAMLFCALCGIAAVYFTWGWTGGRRTLAQKTWRMRVVGPGGAALEYRRAFARYLAGWIGPALALATYAAARSYGLGGVAIVALAVNYLAALVDPERQFLHDRIAGTRIVRD